MARIYSFGAIGSAPIGEHSIGDSSTYPLTTEVAPGIAWGGDGAAIKVKRRWVVRVGKRLVEYASAEEADAATAAMEEAKRKQSQPKPKQKPKKAAPSKPVEIEKVTPAQTVYLDQIKELAQQYDEMDAYRAAIEKQRYTALLALFERLQDEADVEQLLLSIA